MQEALASIGEENVLLNPPRRHVQDGMTRPSERCSATTTYQEGRERERVESGREIDWKTGSLEPEDRRVHLLFTTHSIDLGSWIFEMGRMSHSRWDRT